MCKMESIQEAQKVLCETADLPPSARRSAMRTQHRQSDRVGWFGIKL